MTQTDLPPQQPQPESTTPAKSLVYEPHYYQTVYGNYERQNPPEKYQHYWEMIRRYGPIPNSLLDFGCANGRFLEFLNKSGYIPFNGLFGTDVNQAALDRASAVLLKNHLVFGGRDALPEFPKMDVITALDVLEHLPDLEETLDALHQQLTSGGVLMAVVPVYDGPLGPLVHLLDKDPTHIHKKSRQFWLDLLSSKFKLRHWHGIMRYLMPGGVYLHNPTKAFRAVTPAILMVAQKA